MSTAAPVSTGGALAETYRNLWGGGELALRQAAHRPDEVPGHGSPRWGLSLVVRVDGAAREALAAELETLALLCRAPHLVYRPEDLHLTVRSLQGFADEVAPADLAHYAGQARRAVEGIGELAVTLRGLGGSPGGLFACGYPTPALRELRRRLLDGAAAGRLPAVPGGDGERMRDTAHASLVVYRPPVVAEEALADHVSARGEAEYGTLAVRSLSLARYRPTATEVELEELERIELAG